MMSGRTTTDPARLDRGDKVRVLAWVDQAENGVDVLTFPRNPHHPDGPGVAAEVRVSDLIAQHIEPAPAPYTEPRDGDEVEVTVRGTLVRHCGDPDCGDWSLQADVPGYGRQCYQVLRNVWAEGRVRLVKAAAPQFEAGRIYRSEATGERWLLYRTDAIDDDGQPWFHIDAGRYARMWHRADDVPSDLVPCDVVPREAT